MRAITLPAALLFTLALSACSPADAGDKAADEKPPVVKPGEKYLEQAEQAEATMKAADGTPGNEPANFIRSSWPGKFLRIIKGEEPVTSEKQLLGASQQVMKWLRDVKRGMKWPEPPTGDVPYAADAPKIDGVLDDAAWKNALQFEGLYAFAKTEKHDDPKTVYRLLWDDENLYVSFECADTDLIVHEDDPPVERDGNVFFADCVEIFVCPLRRTGAYWEIVVGPNGAIFDALHSKKFQEWGSVMRKDEDIKGLAAAAKAEGTINDSDDEDTGYCVEMAVPFNQLPEYSRAKPAAGQTLNIMLVRLDKQGKKHTAWAFTPLLSWGHNIWNHAIVTLVKEQ